MDVVSPYAHQAKHIGLWSKEREDEVGEVIATDLHGTRPVTSSPNNLVILQEQVEEMKKKEERMEKKMAELTAENKRLTEPLQKAREEVEELRRQLANYEKDKETLRVCAAVLSLHVESLVLR